MKTIFLTQFLLIVVITTVLPICVRSKAVKKVIRICSELNCSEHSIGEENRDEAQTINGTNSGNKSIGKNIVPASNNTNSRSENGTRDLKSIPGIITTALPNETRLPRKKGITKLTPRNGFKTKINSTIFQDTQNNGPKLSWKYANNRDSALTHINSSIFLSTDKTRKYNHTIKVTNLTDVGIHSDEESYSKESDSGQAEFKLSAQGLPSMDIFGGAPDPFAELHGAIGYARSETLYDTRDPKWSDTFTIYYKPDENQEIQIEVRDHDPWNPDDSIGWATLKLAYVADECETVIPINNGRGGNLIVKRQGGCGLAWWKIFLIVLGSIFVAIVCGIISIKAK